MKPPGLVVRDGRRWSGWRFGCGLAPSEPLGERSPHTLTGFARTKRLRLGVTCIWVEPAPTSPAFPAFSHDGAILTEREFRGQEGKGRRRTPKKEEELWVEVLEEDATEENGISNRQDSPSFIPPLTAIREEPGEYQVAGDDSDSDADPGPDVDWKRKPESRRCGQR